ncbi:MAG TPA: methylated-DNA--[protein]-cysteine S-methyltransferase [Thermomicrobiales bacterium]|nr:methylated-DNA--[protein]-cysteine S-methyltransferase [Thermomicrobiales bacterium]
MGTASATGGAKRAGGIEVATATLATAHGDLALYGTARGLLAVALPGEDRAALERRLRRALGPVAFVADAAALRPALEQLAAYFAGARRAFDLALDPQGTPFQRAVWAAVAAIPYGETRTYGELARAIGRPAAARAVGAANGANPLPPIVPCHRLVGADGGLTGYGGGLPLKRALLALEGAR